MENITDAQLITLYREGNPRAFEGIVNRYAQVIYRFVFKMVKNRDIAHDIVQDTFIKVWKNIKEFDNSKNFKTWIFIIANNTTLDLLRKRKDTTFSTLDSEEENFDQNIPDTEPLQYELFEKQENVELIEKALDTISPESRTIVLLHDGEDMTFEEIANVVNRPMNTVKSQYRRSLLSLKKYIESMNAPKS